MTSFVIADDICGTNNASTNTLASISEVARDQTVLKGTSLSNDDDVCSQSFI